MFSDLDSDGDINIWHLWAPRPARWWLFRHSHIKASSILDGKIVFGYSRLLLAHNLHIWDSDSRRGFPLYLDKRRNSQQAGCKTHVGRKHFFLAGLVVKARSGFTPGCSLVTIFSSGRILCFDSCPCFRCRVYKRLATVWQHFAYESQRGGAGWANNVLCHFAVRSLALAHMHTHTH